MIKLQNSSMIVKLQLSICIILTTISPYLSGLVLDIVLLNIKNKSSKTNSEQRAKGQANTCLAGKGLLGYIKITW